MQTRILGMLFACAATSFAVIGLADTSVQEYTFEIARQPIAATLQEFSKQTGLNVSFVAKDANQKNLLIGPIRGRYTVESALNELLADSGLAFTRVNNVTIAVTSRGGERAGRTGMIGRIRNDSKPRFQQLADRGFVEDTPRDIGGQRVATAAAAESSPAARHERITQAGRSRTMEEVIVTAQKRSEHVQDVPVPVTAINATTLTESSQLRLQDYYSKVPGLGLALIGNGSAPVITVRGITTGGTTNPTVGIAVDDVPYGASVTTGGTLSVPDIDPGDLARVEVLRGPQGTLYGATSIGGLLKFVTADPSTEGVSGRIQVGSSSVHSGDELGYNVRGSINVPLGDTLAVRASGFTTREPGYVDNAQTGQQDINRNDSDGGRLSALWKPSESFSLKLSALIQDSDRLGTSDIDVRLQGLQQSALRGTGLYGRKAEAYSVTMAGTLGNVGLTSVTGYNVDKTFIRSDATPAFGGLANTNFGVAGAAIPLHSDVDKITQEFRVSIPIGDSVDWLIGAFYTDEDIDTTTDAQAVDPATGAVAGSLLQSSFPTTFEEYAAFTNITFTVTERFDIQFGGRISEYEQTFSTIRSGRLSPLFFGRDPFMSPEVKAKDSPFTYLVTPRFKISPDFMVYARLASGYRPGGPNVNCGIAGIPCEFDADTTENYEVGVKGSVLDRMLSFDASVYYIDWKDIQISFFAGGFGWTDNASEAKSQGVELSVESEPLEGLTLSAWGAWNDAELTSDFPSATVFGRSGDRLPYSSRFSGNVSVDQEFPLWTAATGFIGGSVSYVGERKGTFKATPVRETFPDYTRVDLRAGVRFDTWTVNAFLNNVTDERGILRSGLDALRPTFFTYIQPRTVGITLAKTF